MLSDPHYALYLVLAVNCLALPGPRDIEKCDYTLSASLYLPLYQGLLSFLAVRALPSMRHRPSKIHDQSLPPRSPSPATKKNVYSCLYYSRVKAPVMLPDQTEAPFQG